ncbi:NepR family anti-sigma factor [Cereibacter sediminicola]|uniref:NepR family anti-sigma factor n=1 Tax=Cereibacter sediminicola TaxID=2584941 RepID=UPI0011A040D5|nr:NepR family anti-sigma factor [Cereibacter sediminicola]
MTQSTEPKASPAEAAVKGRGKTKEGNRKELQRQIDENLRRVYEEALVQEIPDRFAQLLDQLRQKGPGI